TKSNEWTGKHSFQGRCLHDVSSPQLNPYEDVIDIVGRTLRDFDDDNIIPCYGFGDATTGDHSVFTFVPPSERQLPGYSLEGIRARYRDIAPNVVMAGPTSFAPIIRQAVEVVKENHNAYHILVVIADGQVTRSVDVEPGQFSPQERATMDALVFASQYPLSIIVVGVGDGPWDLMHNFDDNLPQRTFDNFQFVEFNRVVQGIANPTQREIRFALTALMEIPDQFVTVRRLNLGRRHQPPSSVSPPQVLPPPEPLSGFVPIYAAPPLATPVSVLSYATPALPYPTPSSQHYPLKSVSPPYASPPTNGFAPPQHYSVKSVLPPYASPPTRDLPVAAPAPTNVSLKSVPSTTPPPRSPPAPVAEVLVSCPVCHKDNPTTATRCHVCDSPLTTTTTSPLDQDRLVHVVREMHEAQLCPICEDQKKDVVFQCGHETCTSCGDQLSLCPICRVAITQRIRRFV
ncbi:hypothetical protein As57867_018517, partial [Aphanomyces stellatus]